MFVAAVNDIHVQDINIFSIIHLACKIIKLKATLLETQMCRCNKFNNNGPSSRHRLLIKKYTYKYIRILKKHFSRDFSPINRIYKTRIFPFKSPACVYAGYKIKL